MEADQTIEKALEYPEIVDLRHLLLKIRIEQNPKIALLCTTLGKLEHLQNSQ